jgi:hypothetical protein
LENFLQSDSAKQDFWKQKREAKSKELEQKYSQIAPGIPLVNVSFKNIFFDKCQEYFGELLNAKHGIEEFERWDGYEITRMFGKGLNPTSLKTAQNNIEYFVNNIKPQSNEIRVLEYGPGSGWSTVMLYNKLKETFPNHAIHLLSVDISPHSIVATQNTLDYSLIPWQTILEPTDYTKLLDTDKKITLILGDFIEISQKQEDNSFDGFFSSHGTAYLSKNQYLDLFSSINRIGKHNSVIVVDSLDPLYTVNLNTLHLIYCSMFPNMALKLPTYIYGKSKRSNSKFFPGQEVKNLVQVHNEESLLFYRWNNYLIKNLRFNYLLQMLNSIKITTTVIEEYREDVFPSYLLKDLLIDNQYKNFTNLTDIPKCPLYISNAGFILKKS